jgi:hypothetical protein
MAFTVKGCHHRLRCPSAHSVSTRSQLSRPRWRSDFAQQPSRSKTKICASNDSETNDDKSDSERKAFDMPGFLKPLSDFGVGKKSVWEGGVGLFVLAGAGK